ncbi:hypothetical protein V8C37DRAFT_236279 [Trichoderma ceciliae]
MQRQFVAALFYPNHDFVFSRFNFVVCCLAQRTVRMYIPLYPTQPEALKRHGPTEDKRVHWIHVQDHLPAISTILKHTDSIKQPFSLVERRSSSAAHTNVIIGLVVGLTLAAFVIGVCIFLCCYGDSVRFSNKKHRQRRRSMSSRGSRNSKNSREAEHAEGAGVEGERGAA